MLIIVHSQLLKQCSLNNLNYIILCHTVHHTTMVSSNRDSHFDNIFHSLYLCSHAFLKFNIFKVTVLSLDYNIAVLLPPLPMCSYPFNKFLLSCFLSSSFKVNKVTLLQTFWHYWTLYLFIALYSVSACFDSAWKLCGVNMNEVSRLYVKLLRLKRVSFLSCMERIWVKFPIMIWPSEVHLLICKTAHIFHISHFSCMGYGKDKWTTC